MVARPAAVIESLLTAEEGSAGWYLDLAMNELVETLRFLVDIPSPTGQEAGLRDAIATRLGAHPCFKIADSLVVGEPAAGKVLLAGHLDTVPLQGETGSRIEGDRVHGLGSTDMKSGLAVTIHLIETLGTDSLIGVFYAGEEGPLAGNQLGSILNQFPELVDASAGVVLEPTNRAIDAGCNGAINAAVSFLGEPAHSARPWLGVNAITRAGKFLTQLDDLEPEDHEVNGLVFREVMSVTRANGGIANNVIPGRFDLNVNYRFAPDRSLEAAIDAFRQFCAAADQFEVSDASPAAAPDVEHPFFQKLAEISSSEILPKQGWTDVAQLAERGIPAVNFGPGEASLAHKPGESVRISDLAWAYESLLECLVEGSGRESTQSSVS